MKFRSAQQLMNEQKLVKHYAGSHAYGTALPTSDVDFRGIFAADPVNVRTPFFPVRETEDSSEEDTKYYELAHFMKLCLDCNPNIVETLWVDESSIVYSTDAYNHLRSFRERLLSSKIAFTTSGYALSQLKRIKGHNKWINNPQPEEPPKPYDFLSVVQWYGKEKNLNPELPFFRNNYRLVPYGGNIFGVYPWEDGKLWDERGNLNTRFDESREDLGAPLMLVKWNKEEYKLAKEKHEQYWEWKTNRNKDRSKLEEYYGFDTKHAMHLVRLLRMGQEALEHGVLRVKRPDAEELLQIRDGHWSYTRILEYAEDMDNLVRNVWYKKTELPKRPDIKFAAALLMDVQDMVWTK